MRIFAEIVLHFLRIVYVATNLDPGLRKADFLRQPLARENVGVVRPLEFWNEIVENGGD